MAALSLASSAAGHSVVKDDSPEFREHLMSEAWWNRPRAVAALDISDELRARMDVVLAAYLLEAIGSVQQQNEAFAAMGEALIAGDGVSAGSDADRLLQVISDPIQQQLTMMIEVSALLSPEQKKAALAHSPGLFSRFWVKSLLPTPNRVNRNMKAVKHKKRREDQADPDPK